ncbi:hypothetical protein [Streptomyces sp. LN785]|uniref:hypothetical protein n=1 Tax=Streptomyces sp. LN785 TaxID=3112983 RepID=UPI003715254F
MSKKQTRQNRGARTGGHERSAATEAKEQTQTPSVPDALHAISEPTVSHKKQRKFGHN